MARIRPLLTALLVVIAVATSSSSPPFAHAWPSGKAVERDRDIDEFRSRAEAPESRSLRQTVERALNPEHHLSATERVARALRQGDDKALRKLQGSQTQKIIRPADIPQARQTIAFQEFANPPKSGSPETPPALYFHLFPRTKSLEGSEAQSGRPGHAFVRSGDRFFVFERAEENQPWVRLEPAHASEYLKADLRLRAANLSDDHATVYSVITDGAAIRVLEQGQPDFVVSTQPDSAPTQLDRALLARWFANRTVILSVPEFLGPTARKEVRSVVNDLQRRDPSLRIFVDDPKPGIGARVFAAAQRSVGDRIDVVIPAPGYQVIDGAALQDLSGMLRRAQINVRYFQPEQSTFPSDTALIVIAGHSADELHAYVEALIAAKAFNHNHVVFASCGTALTAVLARKILDAGATSLLSFDGTITDGQVQQMLKSLVKARQEARPPGLVEHLVRWLVANGIPGAWEARTTSRQGARHG